MKNAANCSSTDKMRAGNSIMMQWYGLIGIYRYAFYRKITGYYQKCGEMHRKKPLSYTNNSRRTTFILQSIFDDYADTAECKCAFKKVLTNDIASNFETTTKLRAYLSKKTALSRIIVSFVASLAVFLTYFFRFASRQKEQAFQSMQCRSRNRTLGRASQSCIKQFAKLIISLLWK